MIRDDRLLISRYRKGQGPDVPLGKFDYMIEGMMIGGFSLVVVLADYRVTRVKTFMIDYDGIVYEKDLGQHSHRQKKWSSTIRPRRRAHI
jgi:Protein of unknown function (DUF2950)